MSFIYDAPGPRTRRNVRIASVISALALVALVAAGLWQFGSHDQLNPQRWAPFTQWVVWQYLLTGLLGTLQSAGIVAVLGSVLGTLLALGRLSRRRPVRWVCIAYIEVARTVPVLLLIYLMLFGLPQLGINVPTLWKMVIPLTFVTAAVFAEIVRAGITSLPSGQAEAALSLGLKHSQTMRLVVLPQALRNVAPSLLTQFVSLLKDTTLGYIVAYTELLYRGQLLTSYINQLIPTYIVVTLIYLVVSGSLTALASRLQKRTTTKSSVLPLLPPPVPVLEHAHK
ncbi:amino acid ABC transporter permease [Pseudarthrobacter sp. NIBRBAC000502770]|uniref:amino acid ABC transporter permease n=1 Tax=Pseudarthrobacter sp. NIBRBAC000502770 TaxID=2590785 RepID=UPI00113FF6CF|nr:amino acid ABC transporter permease [Pseudarthrobacter sp. NIBRBAC000502770]QDG89046.1 amino acid ABC transporter permease [Pseudarthrobacter sp. NIBRBAC000502770]